MDRIAPLARENVPAELQPILEFAEQLIGFVPNDILTMARWPALLHSLTAMVGEVYGPGEVSDELKMLVGFISSTASGCSYCQAHTLHGASEAGTTSAKLAAAWEFETSDLYTEAERAALRVARGGGSQPNGVTDEDFANLRKHFSEQQILEIVAVIGLFGFLNRWNETMATALETKPEQLFAATLEKRDGER